MSFRGVRGNLTKGKKKLGSVMTGGKRGYYRYSAQVNVLGVWWERWGMAAVKGKKMATVPKIGEKLPPEKRERVKTERGGDAPKKSFRGLIEQMHRGEQQIPRKGGGPTKGSKRHSGSEEIHDEFPPEEGDGPQWGKEKALG